MRQTRRVSHRLIGAAVAASLAIGSLAGPASASLFHIEFPAGLACAGFDLAIDGEEGAGGSTYREFTARDGSVVRVLSAGTGYILTFTNLTTGESLTTQSNGAVSSTRFLPDGTQAVMGLGHNVIILFPSDVPAGPSTTLFVGRVTYTVDASGVFTMLTTSGRSTDICAALR